MENKKSLFISKQIRKLTRTENKYVINILEIIQDKSHKINTKFKEFSNNIRSQNKWIFFTDSF